ncbi:Uncharacterised protein [Legionella pneumophila]|nr:Uncharacterised protein [Legionella pneumophila]
MKCAFECIDDGSTERLFKAPRFGFSMPSLWAVLPSVSH